MILEPFASSRPMMRRQLRRLALPAVVAILLMLVGLIAAQRYLFRAGQAAPVPAMTAPLPDALAQPNLFKPLSAEQAIEANTQLPFAQRKDTAAHKFVLQVESDDRGRAIECLAQAVYYEAASENAEGKRAVAQVVLNRLRHPGYPSSVCGVVYQGSERVMGCQFTFTCDGSLLRPPNPAMFAAARKIAVEALGGRVFAAAGHATNYHADYVLPYWAASLDKQVQIGRHIFYRLKGNLGSASAFGQRHAGREPAIIPQGTMIVAGQAVTDSSDTLASDLSGSFTTDRLPNPIIVADEVTSEPLVADSRSGALMIDEGALASPNKKAIATKGCQTNGSTRLLPAGPNDLRSNTKSDC